MSSTPAHSRCASTARGAEPLRGTGAQPLASRDEGFRGTRDVGAVPWYPRGAGAPGARVGQGYAGLMASGYSKLLSGMGVLNV